MFKRKISVSILAIMLLIIFFITQAFGANNSGIYFSQIDKKETTKETSYNGYIATKDFYNLTGESYDKVISEKFGDSTRIVTWEEIKSKFSDEIASFCDAVGLENENYAAVTYKGKQLLGDRIYFVQRFNRSIPSYFAIHDKIVDGDDILALGSWPHEKRLLIYKDPSVVEPDPVKPDPIEPNPDKTAQLIGDWSYTGDGWINNQDLTDTGSVSFKGYIDDKTGEEYVTSYSDHGEYRLGSLIKPYSDKNVSTMIKVSDFIQNDGTFKVIAHGIYLRVASYSENKIKLMSDISPTCEAVYILTRGTSDNPTPTPDDPTPTPDNPTPTPDNPTPTSTSSSGGGGCSVCELNLGFAFMALLPVFFLRR